MKIAAILTCFNRVEKTKKCLSSLFNQLPEIDVYLTDDNSSDGTSEMIKTNFPQVKLFQGDGNLFWCRGMHNSWKHVDNSKYDYMLWLNDDIELVDGFFDELLKCSQKHNENCIVSGIVGNILQPTQILYGGRDVNNKLVLPQSPPMEIKKMNGNVVLIPSHVIKEIGIIDPFFHHDLGDIEYGLRAMKNGYKVVGTTKIIAYGHHNPINRLRKSGVNITDRFKYLYSPFGFNPNELFYLHKEYYGYFKAVMYYMYEVTYNTLPDWMIKQ